MVKKIRLGFCSTAAIALGVSLASYSGAADAAERAYEMNVYVDVVGGQRVIAGDYAGAVEAASRYAEKGGARGMVANTNLCVALTKTGRFAKAESACTKAVALAERRRMEVSLYDSRTRRQDIAITLSNRGVLKAVSGDPLGAARDFRDAAGFARMGVGVPARNLAYLEALMPDRVAMNDDRRARD